VITVDEIMTTRPYTLPGTATLADAIRVMAEKSIATSRSWMPEASWRAS
jgi:CBS domain-containing protein